MADIRDYGLLLCGTCLDLTKWYLWARARFEWKPNLPYLPPSMLQKFSKVSNQIVEYCEVNTILQVILADLPQESIDKIDLCISQGSLSVDQYI